MAINHIVGGRGSTTSGSYSPAQLVTPPYPVGLPPHYGIYSPGVVGVGEAPATDATHRILNASTATLPTGWSEARSTTATYYNSSGVVSTASSNTLRNDYTSGGLLRGYLLEGAATNLLNWSQSITTGNQPPWHDTPGCATVTSTTTADPAGGTTASTINFAASGGTGGTGGAVYEQQMPASLNTVYTLSAWMKSSATGGASFVRFSSNNSFAWNTGMGQKFTLTSTWTRYTMTGVMLSSQGAVNNVINVGFDSREPVGGTWDNTIAGNVDVWGIQLELGTVATSYIPTTTANVTRAADVATFTLDAAATDLALTYDDSSVTVYTGVPPGSTFNVPTSSTLRLLYADDNVPSAGSVGAAAGSGAATAVGIGLATAVGSAAGSGTATAGVVAWNASDKNADVTLSGGDLTAVHSGATSQHEVVRGNTAGVAGQYFETVFTTIDTTGSTSLVGLANSTQSLSSFMQDPNGIGYSASGFADGPGVFSSGHPPFGVNDAVGVELLAGSANIYKNGTLIFTFPTLPSGSLYPALSLYVQNDTAVTNFGSKAFSYLPSGDTGWNGLTPSAGNVGAASGSGSASGVGASTANSVGASSGTGTATAVGASTAAATGSAAGSGATTAVGASAAAAAGSVTGSGAATAVGASTARSIGAAAGSGTATAVGAATGASIGSAAGSGPATAIGASTAASVGSSTGSGSATAVGARTAASVGSATGSGTATAAAISSAVGSAAGTGSAPAVGIASTTAIGSVAGSGTTTAVGASTAASVGTSTASSTVTAVGAASAAGVGASAGSGTATAVGTATAAGVGSSSGHATAAAFTGIVAQAAGSGAASGSGASTAASVGSAAGSATVTAASSSASSGSAAGISTVSGVGQAVSVAVGSATGIGSAAGTSSGVTINAVGSSAGAGSASATSPAAVTTIVSAIGTAAGSSTSIGYAPSVDFSNDFDDDFAILQTTLPQQNDFGLDFNFDFAILRAEDFNEDFGDDFAVSHISRDLLEDFNEDFSDDFAVFHISKHIIEDFNDDFSNDFAVHHGVQRIVSGVGRAGGASIVSGTIFGITAGTPVVDLPPGVEPPPPVYPAPPPPIPLVWRPAIEYRRVQAPRAIRIHRRGTELRKATPRSMKRRYG